MSSNHDSSATVMEKVRRALGRTAPLKVAPVPPPINEPITRLVHTDIGLPELFAKRAGELKMYVTPVSVDDLIEQIVAFLRSKKCQRIMLPGGPLLEKLGVAKHLEQSGFFVRTWSQMTLDDAYEFDAAVTDVYKAVAEAGALVIKASPQHGR
ncbi:MAG: hypothetical protein ACREIT_09535, partial [Tepidisphaeraceae bacterium]